jgi:hypothetical protein
MMRGNPSSPRSEKNSSGDSKGQSPFVIIGIAKSIEIERR